jgi:hypothetical protein
MVLRLKNQIYDRSGLLKRNSIRLNKQTHNKKRIAFVFCFKNHGWPVLIEQPATTIVARAHKNRITAPSLWRRATSERRECRRYPRRSDTRCRRATARRETVDDLRYSTCRAAASALRSLRLRGSAALSRRDDAPRASRQCDAGWGSCVDVCYKKQTISN